MTAKSDTQTNFMPPPHARILVAVSGGVDSTAAAAILAEAGYTCFGATLDLETRLASIAVEGEPRFKPGTIDKAKEICERLQIPHHVLQAGEAFSRHIIEPFAAAYAAGRTPNPCVRCNRMIKFGLFFQEARRLGCDFMATGHYARLLERDGRMTLRRAGYPRKDQSYALAPLTQTQLRRSCFPLGDLSKTEALAIALEIDPVMADTQESQDICFVSDGDYARLVAARRPAAGGGFIRDLEGNVLGHHKGIHYYTIGQRRGLGVSAEEPLYVIHIEAATNTLYVGREKQTYIQDFSTERLCWGKLEPRILPFQAWVQLRYKHTAVPCVVTPAGRGASVHLAQPQRAVTPGQWAVFYDEDGWVCAAAEIRDFILPRQS